MSESLDQVKFQSEMWRRERQALLEMTGLLDEHPEGYEGPCLCRLCCSYEADMVEDNDG